MTKFCWGCMQQCQHEKSQFCTVPGSPVNHEAIMRVHPSNWKMKVNFFCTKHGMIDTMHLYVLLSVVLNSCAQATAVSCFATDAGQRRIWLMWDMYTQQWLATLDPHHFVVFHLGQLQYRSRMCDHMWSYVTVQNYIAHFWELMRYEDINMH